MAITVLDDFVYYSDLGLELIERADKLNGDFIYLFLKTSHNP